MAGGGIFVAGSIVVTHTILLEDTSADFLFAIMATIFFLVGMYFIEKGMEDD